MMWSTDRLIEFRNARLRNFIKHAAATVPYYRQMFAEKGIDPDGIRTIEDLKAIPILSRTEAVRLGKLDPDMNVEEGVSIRAVQREYARIVEIPLKDAPTPKDIFEIATGELQGNKDAAIKSYNRMGEVLGDAIANVLTLIDGIAVIGGGVAGASSLFFPRMIEEMKSNYENPNRDIYRRLAVRAFNLEDDNDLALFKKGDSKEISVPGSSKKIIYDPMSRTGVGISKIGTQKAVALGAYAFALNKLNCT